MKKYVLPTLVLLAAAGTLALYLRPAGTDYQGDGYALQAPRNWKTLQIAPVDVAFVLADGPEKRAFRPTITLVVSPSNEAIATTSETVKNILAGLDQPQNAFVLRDKQDTTLHGLHCTTLTYTLTANGNRLAGTLSLVSAGKTYIFSYTTLENEHERYLPDFQALLASFHPTS